MTGTSQDEFTIGSWAFSQEHREPVRILESQTIWKHTSYLVWRPNHEAVVWITADQLLPLDQPRPKTFDHLLYRVAAARVVEGLSEDVLLAPLEAGVIPLPHQLVALSKAMSGDRVRYLLADEVGLGKTIEAGLTIRKLKLRGLVKRVLVFAPRHEIAGMWQLLERNVTWNGFVTEPRRRDLKNISNLPRSSKLCILKRCGRASRRLGITAMTRPLPRWPGGSRMTSFRKTRHC